MAHAALVALLVTPAILAGCLGDDTAIEPTALPAPEPVGALQERVVRLLTDPEGDAHVFDAATAVTLAVAGCRLVPESDAVCEVVDRPAPDAGAPGPATSDIRSVSFIERSDALGVELTIAELPARIEDLVQADGSYIEYGVCWRVLDQECLHSNWTGQVQWPESVYITAVGGAESALTWPPAYWFEGPGCEANVCQSRIEVEWISGTPGMIRWWVPRWVMMDAAEGAVIQDVEAYVYTAQAGPTVPMMVEVAALRAGGSVGFGVVTADRTVRAEPFTFLTPATSGPKTMGTPRLLDEGLDLGHGGVNVDVDVFEIIERPDTLTFATRFVDLRRDITDVTAVVLVVVDPGGFVWIDRRHEGGTMQVKAQICATTCIQSTPIPVDVDVAPGRPGWINYTLDRADLGAPAAGSRIRGATTSTWGQDVATTTVGPAALHALGPPMFDIIMAPPLGPLQHDTSSEAPTVAHPDGIVFDEAGDTQDPAGLTSPGAYDARSVTAVGQGDTHVALTLGLADLQATPVPLGFDAVIYAVGMETARGATMTYFIRPREGPAASYCAQDTLVLVDTPRDPSNVISTEIDQIVSRGTQDGGRGTGAGGGAITFVGPRECFGIPPGTDVAVSRLAGAVFLVQERPGLDNELTLVDRTESAEPFTLRPHTAAVVPASFWSQPFGVENFWDMFGAVLAIITAVVTIAILWRRRRALQRYINAIDGLEAEFKDRPGDRAQALVALRTQLHSDLIRHRVSDAHYSIILDRLRSRITSARLMSVGEKIYDIPAHLALRIERLLDDGRLTAEEHRALLPALERTKMAKETHTLLCERLSSWVAEDAKGANA